MDQNGRPPTPVASPRVAAPVDADDLPPWLASALAATGMDLADALVADSDAAPPDVYDGHDELVLRVIAPALGIALDSGQLDPARAAVYLRATTGHTVGVIAAAVAISLPDAAAVPVEALGDALADLLDHLAELDEAGLLDHALAPAPRASSAQSPSPQALSPQALSPQACRRSPRPNGGCGRSAIRRPGATIPSAHARRALPLMLSARRRGVPR